MTLMPLKLISTRGDHNKLVMISACFKLMSLSDSFWNLEITYILPCREPRVHMYLSILFCVKLIGIINSNHTTLCPVALHFVQIVFSH